MLFTKSIQELQSHVIDGAADDVVLEKGQDVIAALLEIAERGYDAAEVQIWSKGRKVKK